MRRRTLLSLPLLAPRAQAAARFTEELWGAIGPIYAKTLQHPFLKSLGDGTLDRRKFQFYLTQDALYLTAFAKALEALAAKWPKPEWSIDFQRDAKEAVDTERLMHKEILASYGVNLQQAAAA